jgi:hypothetical protein
MERVALGKVIHILANARPFAFEETVDGLGELGVG